MLPISPQRKRSKLLVRFSLLAFLVTAVLLIMTCHASTSQAETKTERFQSYLDQQGTPPTSANIAGCQLTPQHPEPIILVPGTLETMAFNWSSLSPKLASKGYCVYSLNYGNFFLQPSAGPIDQSAKELRDFVNKILYYTGASKVSIIGHSQGGMMPRYYIKYLGGAKVVDNLIGLVPSNHGTKVSNWVKPVSIGSCPACDEQGMGSPFLTRLNQEDETPGNVSYTIISTRYDEVVVPYNSAFLSNSPGQPPVQGTRGNVTNITLQDYNSLDLSGHVAISYDNFAYNFVFDALSHAGPANPQRALR